ncbi:hypothetical protein Hanom_Chr17g01560491 [Helianthus anomalus]
MDPFPFESMLANKAWIWSPCGLSPMDLKRAASSRWVRLPSEFMSNRVKMSFSCLIWSEGSGDMIIGLWSMGRVCL